METWFVTDQYIETLFESNHEEADTCMFYSVIVSKDTDVLILLVYMYSKRNFKVVHKNRQ